ncbi:hypothetical protein ACTFIR_010170 [Dictyostelium discoideum]
MKFNNSFFFMSVIFVFLIIIIQFSTATYSRSEIEYYKRLGYDLETGEYTRSSPHQHQQQPQSRQRNRHNSRYGSERRSRQNPYDEDYYSNQNYYQQTANDLDETAPVYKQGVSIPKNINVGISIDEVTPNVIVETNKPTFSQSITKPTEKPTLPPKPSIEPTLPTTRKPVEPELKKTLPPTTQPPETISPKPQTTPAFTQHQISTPSPSPSQQSHHFFYGDGRPADADNDDKEEETKTPTRTYKPINIDDDDEDETKKPTRSNNNDNNKNNNNHRNNNNNNNNNNNDEDDDDEDEDENKNKNKNKGKPNIDDEDNDEDDDEPDETEEPTITGSIEEAKTPDPNLIEGYPSESDPSGSQSIHEDNLIATNSNSSGISGIESRLWICRFLVSTNWLDFMTHNYGLNVFFNAVTSQHFFNHQRFDFSINPPTICLVQIDMNVAAQINLYSGV